MCNSFTNFGYYLAASCWGWPAEGGWTTTCLKSRWSFNNRSRRRRCVRLCPRTSPTSLPWCTSSRTAPPPAPPTVPPPRRPPSRPGTRTKAVSPASAPFKRYTIFWIRLNFVLGAENVLFSRSDCLRPTRWSFRGTPGARALRRPTTTASAPLVYTISTMKAARSRTRWSSAPLRNWKCCGCDTRGLIKMYRVEDWKITPSRKLNCL